MSELTRFENYISKLIPTLKPYAFVDKDKTISHTVMMMLNWTQSMFKYNELPESIPVEYLELYLQTNSNVCIASVDGLLYAFTGGLGGEPDPYHRPTIYTVANPALKLSKTYKIDVDCVVIYNDSLHMGLLPTLNRYSTLLMENEISMNMCSINSRIPFIINALDDNAKVAAEEFIQQILDGRLGIIHSNAFDDDSVKISPNSQSDQRLTNLIEYNQYIKASLYNELGLNANYNMKRESINSNESQLNDDALRPLIQTMLEERKRGIEKVNDMFGTNITVELDSSWKISDKEDKLEMSMQQMHLEALKAQEDHGTPEDKEAPEEEKEDKEDV